MDVGHLALYSNVIHLFKTYKLCLEYIIYAFSVINIILWVLSTQSHTLIMESVYICYFSSVVNVNVTCVNS